MKVLVVSTPGAGHVNPLLPLTRALVEGGDRVRFAAAAEAAPLVDGSGAEFCPAGHGEQEWFDRLRARVRGSPGDGIAPERIDHYFVPRLFGEIAAPDMADDVIACGRQMGPDLVLFENYALAGPLAAAVLGVPCADHLLGPLPANDVLELANDAVSPLWRSFGLDTPGFAGAFAGVTIAICPPSLAAAGVPCGETLMLRPAPLPLTSPVLASRPLVYVTFGTFFDASDVIRSVLEGLADEPLDVVATVGADRDPAELGPLPANARAEAFVAQQSLLPRCAAVVHHGGAGTTFGSLAHGLPQVVIPQGADNFTNAAMLERAGAAVVLSPPEVTGRSVRQAVRKLLDEPGHARAARHLAQEIAAMPGPSEVVHGLHAYVGRTRRAGAAG